MTQNSKHRAFRSVSCRIISFLWNGALYQWKYQNKKKHIKITLRRKPRFIFTFKSHNCQRNRRSAAVESSTIEIEQSLIVIYKFTTDYFLLKNIWYLQYSIHNFSLKNRSKIEKNYLLWAKENKFWIFYLEALKLLAELILGLVSVPVTLPQLLQVISRVWEFCLETIKFSKDSLVELTLPIGVFVRLAILWLYSRWNLDFSMFPV